MASKSNDCFERGSNAIDVHTCSRCRQSNERLTCHDVQLPSVQVSSIKAVVSFKRLIQTFASIASDVLLQVSCVRGGGESTG